MTRLLIRLLVLLVYSAIAWALLIAVLWPIAHLCCSGG